MKISEIIAFMDREYILGATHWWQSQPKDELFDWENDYNALVTNDLYQGKEIPDEPWIPLLARYSVLMQRYKASGHVGKVSIQEAAFYKGEIIPELTHDREIKRCTKCGQIKPSLVPFKVQNRLELYCKECSQK